MSIEIPRLYPPSVLAERGRTSDHRTALLGFGIVGGGFGGRFSPHISSFSDARHFGSLLLVL